MGPDINYYSFFSGGGGGVQADRMKYRGLFSPDVAPLVCQKSFLYGRTGSDAALNEIRASRQAPAEILSVNGNRKSADRLREVKHSHG